MKKILDNLVETARNNSAGITEICLDGIETGFAEFIARAAGGLIRHTKSFGWLVYDPEYRVFVQGERASKTVFLYIEAMARTMFYDAGIISESDHRKAIEKFACKVLSARGVRDIEQLLQNRQSLAVEPGSFDANPFMLNCRGIAVDLRTGAQRPATPADLFMKCAGFRPLPSIEEAYNNIPNFTRFISDITLKKQDIAQYLMHFLGYSLTGDMREQCYLNFWGARGKNGKSTLLNLVRHIWGDYYTEAPESVVLKTKKDDRFDMQFIVGARLVIKADIPQGAWVNIGNIKDITGGDEGFWAEKKYHDGFIFKPKCKIILSSNHRLKLGETGGAIERRLRLMPFQADFRENPDPEMKDKLDAEAPAILTILIDYARKWYEHGLPVSETVEKCSADYILDEDVIRQFVAEKCVRADGESVQTSALYDAFKSWLRSNRAPSRKDFKDRMAERGYDCRKEQRRNENYNKSCFFGLRLLNEGEEKPPEQAELINQDPAMEQIHDSASIASKIDPIFKQFHIESDIGKLFENTPFFGCNGGSGIPEGPGGEVGRPPLKEDILSRNPFDTPKDGGG